MIRLTLTLFTVMLVTSMTTTTYAAATFGATNTYSTTTGRFKSRLSPENYISTVTQMDLQTKSDLSQQAKDLFPKPSSTTAAPGMANQPPASTPNQPAGSVTISNPATPTMQPGTSQQTSPTTPTRPVGAYQSAPSAPAAQQQTNTYTGFGGGSTKGTSSSPSNSGGSTGLGIKY